MRLEDKVKNAFFKIAKVIIPISFAGTIIAMSLNSYKPSEEALQMKREYKEEQKLRAQKHEIPWKRPKITPEEIVKLNKNIETIKNELDKLFDLHNTYFILGGVIGALSLLSAYSSYKYIKKRQKMQLNTFLNENPSTLLDKIAEYPCIPSLLGGAAMFMLWHTIFGYNLKYFPKNLKLNYYLGQVLFSGLGYGGAYSILSGAKLFKKPHFQNFLKSIPAAFKTILSKNNKTKQKYLEQYIDLLKYKDSNYFTSSFKLNIMKKDFLKALDDCKFMIEHKKDFFNDSMLPDLFNTLGVDSIRKIEEYYNKRKCKLNPDNPFFKVFLQFTYLIHSYPEKAKRLVKEITNTENYKEELNFLEALVLDSIDETKASTQQWQKSINLILANPNLIEYIESIPDHKVYRLTFNNFLKNVIMLKQDKKSVLVAEKANLDYLETKINKIFFDIAKPIKILELNNEYYLIEKYALGKSFNSAFKESKNYDLFRKTANYLAVIHAVMPSGKTSKDYYSDIWLKLKSSSLPEKLKQELFENIDCFLDIFYNKPLVFDRDSSTDQWYVADNKIIAFDLVDRGFTPAEFDTSKLFNRGDFFPRTKEGNKLKDNILIKNYLEVYNYHTPKSKKRFEKDFLLSSLNATPIKALTNYLFAITKPSKIKSALDFLDNGIFDIRRILDEFSNTLHKDYKKYEKYANALLELKNYSTIAK